MMADRLIMMKDVYLSKKESLLTSLQNLESRVQGLNKDSSPALVEKSLQRLEEIEGKSVELWEARLGYMGLLTSPQEASVEMAAGRDTQKHVRETVMSLKTSLLSLETQVLPSGASNQRHGPSHRNFFDKWAT